MCFWWSNFPCTAPAQFVHTTFHWQFYDLGTVQTAGTENFIFTVHTLVCLNHCRHSTFRVWLCTITQSVVMSLLHCLNSSSVVHWACQLDRLSLQRHNLMSHCCCWWCHWMGRRWWGLFRQVERLLGICNVHLEFHHFRWWND